MNPVQSKNDFLLNLFRRIYLAPNNEVLKNVFVAFQSQISETPGPQIMTEELTHRFLLANARLQRAEKVPMLLQELMVRVQDCLSKSLQINCVLTMNLKNINGNKIFDSSAIDKFMSAVNLSEYHVTFSDLYFLLGSDWGGKFNHSIDGIDPDPRQTLITFYSLINHAMYLNAGTQSALWKDCKLLDYSEILALNLEQAKKGEINPPNSADLESLKTSDWTLYLPIGYAHEDIFFISLVAINYSENGYRLRLLACDEKPILPAGEKLDHYCPEVIWDGLKVEQLTNSSLWKTLLEAATLKDAELVAVRKSSDSSFLAFDSTYLVPWLTQKLGKRPRILSIKIEDQYWEGLLNNQFPYKSMLCENIQTWKSPTNEWEGDLLLKATGKKMKSSIFMGTLHKFVNLLPLDLLKTKNEMLLFKAESRLLILVGAYLTFKSNLSRLSQRGRFLRLIEQSFGKVTAPIERLMQLEPTDSQRESARILLTSLLDLKHRLADYVRTMDSISLEAPKSLYPSTHLVHRINLSEIAWRPTQQTAFEALRLNDGVPSIPSYDRWTSKLFPEIYDALEAWYHILLDAKSKCEPIEIMMMAHRNVFSKLPIPSTKDVESIFPDPLSEGLVVGTVLLLNKISSLIESEVFSDAFVPPLVVADIARLYRFSIELYRKINPTVRELPVSWFCLHQYYESRHSFHVPGEVKATLEALLASFKLISPEGYRRTSDKFKEIPLFYFSWEEFPVTYKFHRASLGPCGFRHRSVDEVLSIAELADNVGLRPEDTEWSSVLGWENSFSGQCYLAVQEIAQYYTMNIVTTTKAYLEDIGGKDYQRNNIFTALGPENFFQLAPAILTKLIECNNQFGGCNTQYQKQVYAGDPPMSQRMVRFHDMKIGEFISNLPIKKVEEWRDQADLLKVLPRRNAMGGIYQLHQAASGPSSLSLDVLVEYFEARPALLLSVDYRSYFSAVMRSAHVMETACLNEPLVLSRLKSFIMSLYREDQKKLNESSLNFERLIWLSALTRHLCHLSRAVKLNFTPLLKAILKDLFHFARGQSFEVRIAPHLLASQKFLTKDPLSVVELARLHLLMGRNSLCDPNDFMTWLEAAEAMQVQAPYIQYALMNGNEKTRYSLWALILNVDADIQKVINKKPFNLNLATILKVSTQITRHVRKKDYLQSWMTHWQKTSWDREPWREAATENVMLKVNEVLSNDTAEVNINTKYLLNKAQELLCVTPTSLIVQIGGEMITVDWETGRTKGVDNHMPASTSLPVHLRKHADFAPLGSLLRRPLINSVHFQGCQQVSINTSIGAAWLRHGDHEFRLVPSEHLKSMKLPDQLQDGFTVWFSEAKGYIIAAHSTDGTPHPAFFIDESGLIGPLNGNTNLRLAKRGYYPEAQLFDRWCFGQNSILVWLDDNQNIAELHIPLYNGDSKFTRVVLSNEGKWKIDGLDLWLEAINESIPAFAGHPVYLVAKNKEGKRFLLLPEATPYEMQKRREEKNVEVDWNRILTSGSKECIHQYTIMPSGQIEGLTVKDNLLLMCWALYMGHYAATAELAKRWLSPPGRPYTDDEQKILFSWINIKYNDTPMKNESHPSARSLQLFVLVRIARHVRDYPPKPEEGEKMAKLWTALHGSSMESYETRHDIATKLMGRTGLGRQVRSTIFEELISAYDHEAVLRLALEDDRNAYTSIARRLHQRLSGDPKDHVENTTRITTQISGHEIQDNNKSYKWNYNNLVKSFPTTIQKDVVPVEQLYRQLISTDLNSFFNKAYTLIKDGPRNEIETREYAAIIHALEKLHGSAAEDFCFQYFKSYFGVYIEDIGKINLLLWLLLEQAYIAQTAGKELPELPSVNRRFGLTIKDSVDSSNEFFSKLVSLGGIDGENLLESYRIEWFKKRGMRYLKQETVYVTPPESFAESLITPWSEQLTSEIKRWSQLSSLKKPKLDDKLKVKLDKWSYPLPPEWAKTPFTQEGLCTLEKELHHKISILINDQSKAKDHLLALANALPSDENSKILNFARQIHYFTPISIDECIGLALIGQSKSWQKSCPVIAPHLLQEAAIIYLEASLELAHLQRAKKALQCEDKDQFQLMIENLATPHHYLPSDETLLLMVTEYYADCRLRIQPDQALIIQTLTQESLMVKGIVIQAIMGLAGKSKIVAPAWLQKMLGMGCIPFLVVPNFLFRTTLSDLQSMMWNRFKTHVRAFTFNRESCSSDVLHRLAEALHIARIEPTVFVCTPRDLHALQLMLKERHQIIEEMRERLVRFTLNWSAGCLTPEQQKGFKAALLKGDWKGAAKELPNSFINEFTRWNDSHIKLEEELTSFFAEADIIQSILNLLQNEAAMLVDEVSTVYDPRNLLSFPIGWQVPANPQAAAVACKIYFEWLPKFFKDLDLLNNMQSLSSEATRQKMYKEIAQMAWFEYKNLITDIPPIDITVAYLLADRIKGKPMEAFVKQLNADKSVLRRQFAQELAFFKYCLSGGLEGAFTSTAYVNYGRSKQDPQLYLAIPYQCANVPKEDTLFRRPWKTVLMTCQLYSQGWQDPSQTVELIGFMQGIDPSSKNNNILEAASAIWGPRFTNIDPSNQEAIEQLTNELDAARLKPELAQAARLLIQTYLLSCVFPGQLKLDPSQFTSTPQDIPMMAAKADAMGGTFGFSTTWNPKLRLVPDHSSDARILQALAEERNQTCHILPKGGVAAFFDQLEKNRLSGYMALMDAGALFKGLSNTLVASRLLKAFNEFDCILFYDEEQSGGTRLAVLSRSGKTLLEHSDREGVRRTLEQLKLASPFTYYDQARCIGADLDLKDGRALITFSNLVTQDDLLQSCTRCRHLLDGGHSIAYVIPGEMGTEWTGKKVVAASKEMQEYVEKKANFHGICEQMRGTLRAVIDHHMRSTADAEMRHAMHNAAKNFLMEEQKNDLVESFGSLEGVMRKAKDVLIDLKKKLIERIGRLFPESMFLTIESLDSILKWHEVNSTPIPEYVREGEEHDDAVQEVDLSKDLDRVRLMEEEYERMLGSRRPKKEVAWSRFDLQSILPSPMGSFPDGGGMPSLYKLREALKERKFDVPFTSNLLISANLLFTFMGESNCLLTENQKAFHRGLFIKGAQDSIYILISEGDARHLKEHLLGLSDNLGRGVYLVEPSGAINQRGCRNEKIINLWNEGSEKDKCLLLQGLIFQGSALLLEQLPHMEVRKAFELLTQKKLNRKKALSIIFEVALNLRPDDLLLYRRSQKLRELFNTI